MSYNKNQEAIDKYYQDNYDRLREEFVDYLVEEGGYSRFVAEESNDWFDEWLEKDYLNTLNYLSPKSDNGKSNKRTKNKGTQSKIW
mgnify:CR=1